MEDNEYRTKYYNYYKEDNALHYLRLYNLNGSTKQKIKDIKTYLTDTQTNASYFRLYHSYDYEDQYGKINMLVRYLFDKICHATIICFEDLCMAFDEGWHEDEYGDYTYTTKINQDSFQHFAESNTYEDICNQLDYLINQVDDTITIPEINYEIVETFSNYDMFDFGEYEANEKYARM